VSQLSATIGVLATLVQTLSVPAVAPPPAFPVTPSPARTAPFERLSAPPATQQGPHSPPAQVAEVRLLPRVVCGMVVVPVDAAVDPLMVKAAPSDVTFHMRAVKPPVCVD